MMQKKELGKGGDPSFKGSVKGKEEEFLLPLFPQASGKAKK